MTGFDTNVLVRYLVQDDPAQAAQASAAFAALREHAPGWISREVMVETVWVLERAYRLPRDRIADAIDGLLSARELVVEEADRIGLAAQRWREGGAGFADQMIALAGQGAGCRENSDLRQESRENPGDAATGGKVSRAGGFVAHIRV